MLEIILKKIENIESDMNDVKQDMNIMKSKLKNIENINSRMDNHISFIECIYNKLKYPLNSLISSFTNLPETEIIEDVLTIKE